MKRAGYYTRVSTARQEQEATIESQVAEVEGRIKQDGNQLLPSLRFEDNGWSGALLVRPALDQLRDAIKRKEFDILYVYDRGRLSRKFVYQELILEELAEAGIEFITLHDVNATTPEEKVVQSMEGIFHEWDRIRTAEKFRRGKLFKVRSGKLLGYNPLYGYNYIPITKEQNGYFEINEEEAKVVLKIFDWVGNKGYSIRKVIMELYRSKIYPKKRKREFWTKGPIIRLLQNESYIGRHFYYKTEAVIPKNPKNLHGKYKRIKKSSRKVRPKSEWIPYKCPPIVDTALFLKVQKQLELNRKFANRNKKHQYLLSGGLIHCTCGITRVGQKGGSQLYYRCADRIYNYPLPPRCKEGSINVEILDDLVWKRIVRLISNKDLLQKQAEKWLNKKRQTGVDKTGEIKENERRLGLLDEEEQRYLKAFGAGLSSFPVYEKQMKELNNRREIFITEIAEDRAHREEETEFSNLDLRKIHQPVFEGISNWDFSQKEQLIRKIVDKVVANQEMAIVKGYLPLESEVSYGALQPSSWNRRTA